MKEEVYLTTQSPGSKVNLLCETKVGYLGVALGIQKNVLWLEVSVHNVIRVKVLQRLIKQRRMRRRSRRGRCEK